MKANIHPQYHEITFVMTDGTEIVTRSTMGKAGEMVRMQLDVDSKSHPAWTGNTGQVRKTDQMKKFNDRFAGIGIFADKADKKAS